MNAFEQLVMAVQRKSDIIFMVLSINVWVSSYSL